MKDGKKLGSDKRESSKESKDRSGLLSKLPSDNKVAVKDQLNQGSTIDEDGHLNFTAKNSKIKKVEVDKEASGEKNKSPSPPKGVPNVTLEPKKMPRMKASNIDVLESFKNARLNLLDEQNKLEILLNEKNLLQSNEILSARQKRRDEQRAKLQKFAKVMT
jgi:hypothetical protein